MNFNPCEDAESLRTVVRGFFEKRSTERGVRRLMETESGYDIDVWTCAAQELGLHGLAVPEESGGSGAGPVELGVAFEELGAVLYGGPFLSTIGLATSALLEIDDPGTATDYLPSIVAGTTIATLAWAGAAPSRSTIAATRTPCGWRVSGRAPIVIDGSAATLVLVAATTPAGRSLFAVRGADPALARTPQTTLDSTRRLSELRFESVPARLVGVDGEAAQPLRRTFDLATLYLAAEQLGGADRVLTMAVEYAKTRIQFGRPIGSFQTIKHRLADMLVEVETARSVVYHGLWTAANDPANLHVAASLARTIAADAYQAVAAHNIQIHGGIGFTWEHPAHLYLKRAKSSQLLFGSPTQHRARLARLIDLTGEGSTTVTRTQDPPRTSPDAAELEAELTRFLDRHPVPGLTDVAADRAFREARFDAGLAVVNCARGHGGRGLDASLQTIVEQRIAREGAADHTGRNVVGLGMALPTIHAHGTEAQKARHLRRCFSGSEIWCQLFSEPGAGSDLAGLATRAVLNGDHYVVDGQKVWTSLGHVAHWGILLARTDPAVPKHRGLTFFLLDMRTPGVEVRPLRQLTGEAEFNEVYLTGVRIPVGNVLGEVGDGWRVAMTTLSNERIAIGGRPAERGSGPIAQLVEVFRQAHAAGRLDATATDRVMVWWTRAEAARLTNARATARVGRLPGPEGSIAKLQMAEINKTIYELCVDLSGDDALLIDDYAETAPDTSAVHGNTDVRKAWLRSLANSIEGGTSEILRNVLGERVLGLPREPRVDRDIAWKDMPRS